LEPCEHVTFLGYHLLGSCYDALTVAR
jgi:hypothetical protein